MSNPQEQVHEPMEHTPSIIKGALIGGLGCFALSIYTELCNGDLSLLKFGLNEGLVVGFCAVSGVLIGGGHEYAEQRSF